MRVPIVPVRDTRTEKQIPRERHIYRKITTGNVTVMKKSGTASGTSLRSVYIISVLLTYSEKHDEQQRQALRRRTVTEFIADAAGFV